MGGRRWRKWSCFQVSAKEKGRVTLPQPASSGTRQKGRWQRRKQAICLPSTYKCGRNTNFQGGNPEVGCCHWSWQSWYLLNQGRSSFGPTSCLSPCGVRFVCTDCSQCWTSHLIYACGNHTSLSQTTSEIFLPFLTQIQASFYERPVYFCFVILLVKLLCDKGSCSQTQ